MFLYAGWSLTIGSQISRDTCKDRATTLTVLVKIGYSLTFISGPINLFAFITSKSDTS